MWHPNLSNYPCECIERGIVGHILLTCINYEHVEPPPNYPWIMDLSQYLVYTPHLTLYLVKSQFELGILTCRVVLGSKTSSVPLFVHPIIPDRIPCVDLTWISFQTSWIHRYLHSLSYIHIHAWRAVCIQPISCSPAHDWMEITNDSIFVITFQLTISNLFIVQLFIHQD